MGPLVQFALSIVGTLACVAFAWRARRWRRRGDHPHCRRCDFDLFGLPAGTTRCSECGAELTAKWAIAIGARRPPRFVQVLAGVAAIVFAVFAFRVGRAVDWYQTAARVSPTALLIRVVERERSNPLRSWAAVELNRRLQVENLSDASLDRAIIALEPVQLVARPTVRLGEPLWVDVVSGVPNSVGEFGPGNRFHVDRRIKRYRFGTGAWMPGAVVRRAWQWSTTRFERASCRFEPPATTGPTTLECEIEQRLVRNDPSKPWPMRVAWTDAPAFAWTTTVRAPVRISAAGATDDVEFVPGDDRLRAAMSESVRLDRTWQIPTNGVPAVAGCRALVDGSRTCLG